MGWGAIGLLVSLLIVCSLGPGLLLTRVFRWRPAERLCAAVGLSLIVVYLATWTVYVFDLPASVAWFVSAASAASLVACRRDLVHILADRRARQMMIGAACALTWALVLLLAVRYYSGANWTGDWLEHYERSVFFLERPSPTATTFLEGYNSLPARAPLMNVVVAHFLAQTGVSFDAYQVIATYLNALCFLPLTLLLGLLARRGSSAVVVLTCLVLLNPLFAENVTYPWTKLFAAFFALTSMALYVRGWRKNDTSRTVAAFVFLAAGVLAHFSVAVYAVFQGGHYTARTVRSVWSARRDGGHLGGRLLREYGLVVAASVVLMMTWFAWSFATFGWERTVASNSSVVDSATESFGARMTKIETNIVATVVPCCFRSPVPELLELVAQPDPYRWWRDFWFLPYQLNFPSAIGLAGGCVAMWLLVRRLRRRSADARRTLGPAETGRRELRFWCLLLLVCVPLGVAVHGGLDRLGIAQVCLQPLVMIGIAAVAANLAELPIAVRALVALGALLDFVLGILLHFYIQTLEMPSRVFQLGDREAIPWGELGLTHGAVLNFRFKRHYGLVFFGDHASNKAAVLGVIVVIGAIIAGTLSWQAFRGGLSHRRRA
jgi:hypothetical protein